MFVFSKYFYTLYTIKLLVERVTFNLFFQKIINLDEEAPSTLVLPNQWMWDIIDEFIYQFQSFCQFRAKIMNKTEEEMISLKDNVYKVLICFFYLTCSSNILRLTKLN